MTPAASPIADAIVSIFSSASVLGAQTTSKLHYRFLQSASISAVVKWSNLRATAMTMGPGNRYSWDFRISCYIRDTGDPEAVEERVWQTSDLLLGALVGNPTLQDTVEEITSIGMMRSPNIVMTLPTGETWLPFDIVLSVTEWD